MASREVEGYEDIGGAPGRRKMREVYKGGGFGRIVTDEELIRRKGTKRKNRKRKMR